MSARASVLLGPAEITLLVLNAIKDGLEHDFVGTCVKWQIHKHVGDMLASFTYEQIAQLAQRSSTAHLIRLAHGDNTHFWSDLRKALDHNDASGLEFSILSALLVPPTPVAA